MCSSDIGICGFSLMLSSSCTVLECVLRGLSDKIGARIEIHVQLNGAV